MKNMILNYLMSVVAKDGTHDDVKRQEIRYGLEAIYLNISRFIVFFTVNIILGNFIVALLFFLFFIPIKSTTWGFHAKTSWQCWLLSSIGYICMPLLANHLYLDFNLKIILCICFLIAIYCWAPADTPKRPLVNEKKRKTLRINALIVTMIYSIMILYTGFSNILVSALLFQCFMINPFTYMTFNTQYRNYLYYKVT